MSPSRGENKKYLKPPPRKVTEEIINSVFTSRRSNQKTTAPKTASMSVQAYRVGTGYPTFSHMKGWFTRKKPWTDMCSLRFSKVSSVQTKNQKIELRGVFLGRKDFQTFLRLFLAPSGCLNQELKNLVPTGISAGT